MSVQATSYVWEHSQQKGAGLLLMLAIANIADTRGFAYPGVKRLARDIRMSERNTQRLIHALEEDGELQLRRGAGPHGTNIYWIVMNDTLPLFAQGGDNLAPDNMAGDVHATKGVTKPPRPGDKLVAPEPKETKETRRSSGAAPSAQRGPGGEKTPTTETWNAYAEEMQGKYGVAPDRNARTNGQLAQIVARAGKDQAPRLIRFVFQRQNTFYERLRYSLGVILKDLDGLLIEMKQSEKRSSQPSADRWWDDDRKVMERATKEGIQREEGDSFYRVAARLFLKLGDGPWMHKMNRHVEQAYIELARKQPA